MPAYTFTAPLPEKSELAGGGGPRASPQYKYRGAASGGVVGGGDASSALSKASRYNNRRVSEKMNSAISSKDASLIIATPESAALEAMGLTNNKESHSSHRKMLRKGSSRGRGRYGYVFSSGLGYVFSSAMERTFLRLKSTWSDERGRGALQLRKHVETESKLSSSADAFSRFMSALNRRIRDLVNSSNVHERRGGIVAIDVLIDVITEDDEVKIISFANLLRKILQQSSLPSPALVEAARALGHLVRAGGTLTADIVDFEVKRALEWLQGDSDMHRDKRHAAALILKELAENAPTLFSVHLGTFFDTIRVALHDDRVATRAAATRALAACLALVSRRDSDLSVEYYYRIYKIVERGFKKASTETVHGSLLAVGELFHNTKDFMVPRFNEVCATVLKYRGHRDALVRCTVIALMPRLAKFSPDAFVRGYLDECLASLLASTKRSSERSAAFLAIGKLALAVGRTIEDHVPHILALVKDGLTPSKNRKKKAHHCPMALECMSMLARALGGTLQTAAGNEKQLRELQESMFATGLSVKLVYALSDLEKHIPSLRPWVQTRLLHELSLCLSGSMFDILPCGGLWKVSSAAAADKKVESKSSPSSFQFALPIPELDLVRVHASVIVDSPANPSSAAQEEEPSSSLIELALHTLGSFNFDGVNLVPLVHDSILRFLEHPNAAVRRMAALCISELLVPAEKPTYVEGASATLIMACTQRLLTLAVSDPEPSIRTCVIESLDHRFDVYLAQSRCLTPLFLAMNDEHFPVRCGAMNIISRLAPRNPAYVLSFLRKILVQLLKELEYGGEDENPRARQEAAELIGVLISGVFVRGTEEFDRGGDEPVDADVFSEWGGTRQRHAHSIIDATIGIELREDDNVGLSGLMSHEDLDSKSKSNYISLLKKARLRRANANADSISWLRNKFMLADDQAIAFIGPFLSPMMKILLAVLPSINVGTSSAVLWTLGELSLVHTIDMKPYMNEMLPKIIDALHDHSSDKKRCVALRTLGLLVRSTGEVKRPLSQYPHLCDTLLSIINGSAVAPWPLRREAIKTLGIIGALDPYRYKLANKHLHSKGEKIYVDNSDAAEAPLTASSDDYFPTVAIQALQKVLQDPSLAMHHSIVVQAVTHIFRSLGLQCAPFLPSIIPQVLTVMRTCELDLRRMLFQQQSIVVAVVKQHIRPYLDDIFLVIKEFWHQNLEQILTLIEEINLALKDEFIAYLPKVMPNLLDMLDVGAERNRVAPLEAMQKCLHTLSVIGTNLSDHLHLIIPVLTKLIEQTTHVDSKTR